MTSTGAGPSKQPLKHQAQARNLSEQAQASDFHRSRAKPVASAGPGLGQQPLQEQAQDRDTMGLGPNQQLLLEQARAGDLHRSRYKRVASEEASLSQQSVLDQDEVRNLHRNKPDPANSMRPRPNQKLLWD